MNKYKIGDKVRTITDRDDDDYKLFPTGTIGIITRIDDSSKLRYSVRRIGDTDYYRVYHYSEDMLAPYVEKTYEDGLADAWKILKHIQSGELAQNDIWDIWGMDEFAFVNNFTEKYTPQEAIKILEAYEESKAIKVGDVVEIEPDEREWLGVVIGVYAGDNYYVLEKDGEIQTWNAEQLKKTGRHINISSILEQIGGMSSGKNNSKRND